jgi:hypothetical protein
MTQATLTLMDFLLARVAEDEAALRIEQVEVTTYGDLARNQRTFVPGRPITTPDRRRMAECDAKRRIVQMHPGGEHVCPGKPVEWLGIHNTADGPRHYEIWTCATLAALALPYADHPDYSDEWRP